MYLIGITLKYTIQEQPNLYLHSPLAKLLCLQGTVKLLIVMGGVVFGFFD